MPLYLLLAALSAHATQMRYRDVACPLPAGGEQTDVARVYEPVAANTAGGYDSDLATYASGGQAREHAVSTCSRSLFSLYGEDMLKPLPSDAVSRLERALAEELRRLADPDEPEVWERYGIAARMYRELGRSNLHIAQVYLEASWTARDRVVGFHRGLEGPKAVQYLLKEGGPAELAKPLTAEQRRTVLYSLARAAHRGGFAAERDAYLAQFEAQGGLSAQEQAALAEFRRIAGEVEPRYQDLAIASFQAALRDRLSAADRARATYLLADLLRRRGRPGEAAPLYSAVTKDPAAAPQIKEMAALLLEAL